MGNLFLCLFSSIPRKNKEMKKAILLLFSIFSLVPTWILTMEILFNPQRYNVYFGLGLCIFSFIFICGTISIMISYGGITTKSIEETLRMERRMQLRNLDHGFDLKVGDVGVTIRKGYKWALNQGTEFDLVEQHSDEKPDEVVGTGVAIGNWLGRFKNVPNNLLKIEHNEWAQDKDTCFDMMKAGYGDFTEDSEVTALIYERLS